MTFLIKNGTGEYEFTVTDLSPDSKYFKFNIQLPEDIYAGEYQWFLYDDDEIVNQGLLLIEDEVKDITYYNQTQTVKYYGE